jgi:hypothetical protein
MNRGLLARIALVCVLANVGGGACMGGCCESAEEARYGATYESARRHEIDAFEFERPIAEVWPELLNLLSEAGYPLDQKTPVEGRTLETPFKPALGPGEYRFLVRVNRIDQKRYRIALDKQYRHYDDGSAALELEKHEADTDRTHVLWSLIERTEPARFSELQKRVSGKAERAGATGRGCDRGCAACASLVPDPPPAKR